MKNIAPGIGKIFNDPIYGFITIPYQIIFDLIEHPYFQRLRRIKQLGLTHLTYSGAHHTRFHHAIGATHLMQQAVETLRLKGHEITDQEAEAVSIAVLLHDIGHGPFSHALEHSLVENVTHEKISELFMERLNEEFEGKLTLAIEIFKGDYSKRFLHQLVSSQLDMDRLDYLNRDTFFSGVSEGAISSERIIKMLNLFNGELAVEAKGIYSIEKFIVARRLMYWQVYLHKTVLAAEYSLIKVLEKAKAVVEEGADIYGSPALKFFLAARYELSDFKSNPAILEQFALLDDVDIMGAIKVWAQSANDLFLKQISGQLVDRRLNRLTLSNIPISDEKIAQIRSKVKSKLNVSDNDLQYAVYTDKVTNSAYDPESDRINILFKDGTVRDISVTADLLNISSLSQEVNKYLLSYPKGIDD